MPLTLDGTAGMTAPQGAVYNGLATATVQNSTSGTSIDFTGIPLWVKRITIMLNGVSTSGTSTILIQLGSGSVTASGYVGAGVIVSSGTASTSYTAGFGLPGGTGDTATRIVNGLITIANLSSNIWAATGTTSFTTSATAISNTAGSITLSGTLDRVRITTVGGTDTFDAGSINIMYE